MRRGVVAAVSAAVLAAGCAASGGPDGEATPRATLRESATAQATITATPSPSASAEAPPEVDLTAEDGDYRRVVEEILRFREWLFAHPHRQDLVSVIYNEDCNCHADLTETLSNYVDHGRRLSLNFELQSFEFVAEENVSVRLRLSYSSSGEVLDAAGAVVESGTVPANPQEWLLLRDPSGRFRVASQIALGS